MPINNASDYTTRLGMFAIVSGFTGIQGSNGALMEFKEFLSVTARSATRKEGGLSDEP
jgi:hypothetical protein